MVLNETDKEIIRHLGYPKIVNLSSGSYLIKKDFQNKGVNELIGKKLADIMGLVCPRYFIVEVDKERYVLSEDLNQYGEFTSALYLTEKYEDDYESYPLRKLYQNETWYDSDADKILHGNSLYDLWSYFEKNYSSNISRNLMNEMLKVYIFDILFFNYDRDFKNWGILVQKDQINITILDNEMIFSKKDENEGYLVGTVALNVNFTEIHSDIYNDFSHFLKESSLEFIKLFKYYFDLITPEFLKGIINQIERRDNIQIETKEEILENYKNHRMALIEIYDKEIKKGDNHAR